MAKKESSNPKNVPTFQPPRSRGKWGWAIVCFVVAILLVVSFVDYRPEQSAQITTSPTDQNQVGLFGSVVSYYAFSLIGISSWLIPLFLLWLSWILVRRAKRVAISRIFAMLVCIVALCGLAAMANETDWTANRLDRDIYVQGEGGLVGGLIYDKLLAAFLGPIGSLIVFVAAYGMAWFFVFTRDFGAQVEGIFEGFQQWKANRRVQREERRELKRLAKEARKKKKLTEKTAPSVSPAAVSETAAPPITSKFSLDKRPPTEEEKAGKKAPVVGDEPDESDTKPKAHAGLRIVAPEKTRKASAQRPESKGDFIFPSLDILDEPVDATGANSEDEHAANAETLLRTLREFGVEVSLGEIHIGPVITRYEVFPAPGVRVEKISGLDKNIALGMRAQSVRILAPVPGKGCVGVEVPNSKPTPVGIREILESEDWVHAGAEIPIGLGRDVGGKPLISDLTRMPHLLIAGATGSGKTVCINSIITSLLYHSTPEDLRFIMIDPKIVEMKQFNDLPHMLIPVVTDPKKVPGALKWLLSEMEMRYQIFAKVGVRNIAGFNGRKILEKETPAAPSPEEIGGDGEPMLEVPRDGELEIPEKMPYIVVIVDELADLMMVAPADIETGIARLAQLARAAGIHLIIATQRPSVNVITGVIKANLPCRIAFQVASKVDSRTILDFGGADQLIGRGDMLFSPPGTAKIVRAQGALVSDDELNRVVDFLKQNGPPEFEENVQRQIDEPDEGDLGEIEADDEMYEPAIDVLRTTKRASTSMLQRRLRIGYNRAARLMEVLEAKGVVGPENGSSPREILVDLDEL
jgi:S-DNA-T family DNA segregation ATPase FtsK/SpoIIIE